MNEASEYLKYEATLRRCCSVKFSVIPKVRSEKRIDDGSFV